MRPKIAQSTLDATGNTGFQPNVGNNQKGWQKIPELPLHNLACTRTYVLCAAANLHQELHRKIAKKKIELVLINPKLSLNAH